MASRRGCVAKSLGALGGRPRGGYRVRGADSLELPELRPVASIASGCAKSARDPIHLASQFRRCRGAARRATDERL